MKKETQKGITLIALVVTIIVLLILAGITIAMLTGQNGILNRASEAKDANGTAQIDEQVKLAVAEALSNGLGTITDENLRAALDNNVGAGNYTLTGDATNGWTIKAGEKEYKISGNGDVSGGGNTGGNTGTKNPNYSEEVADEDIIPELFLYEIIDENAKTARIIGMNPKYCSGGSSKESNLRKKYATRGLISMDGNYKIASASGSGSGSGSLNDDSDEPIQNTHYDIIFNGKKLSDTLVVPDKKISKNNIEYTITEACLMVKGGYEGIITDEYNGWPNVKTIIFPDTVTSIYMPEDHSTYGEGNETIERIVLPKNLKAIESRANHQRSI